MATTAPLTVLKTTLAMLVAVTAGLSSAAPAVTLAPTALSGILEANPRWTPSVTHDRNMSVEGSTVVGSMASAPPSAATASGNTSATRTSGGSSSSPSPHCSRPKARFCDRWNNNMYKCTNRLRAVRTGEPCPPPCVVSGERFDHGDIIRCQPARANPRLCQRKKNQPASDRYNQAQCCVVCHNGGYQARYTPN